MRHAAIYFAELLARQHQEYQLLFCTDMLNLAEFIGLAPTHIQTIPRVIYFHENQLLYPDKNATERDLHFAFINFTSALAANEIWFNSNWHMQAFYESLQQWLMKMPDFQPRQALASLQEKTRVHYPGIASAFTPNPNKSDHAQITIAWAARWEEDKNPQCLFQALDLLKARNVNFRLNLLGASSAKIPEIFLQAEQHFSDHINYWGYAESQQDYLRLLQGSDVIVSTAVHEFFGIAVLEAIACGCIPLVPERLAYPETLALYKQRHAECFYDGSAEQLAERLAAFSHAFTLKQIDNDYDLLARESLQALHWETRAADMDTALSRLIR